jgi:hypothetical protein
MIEFNSYRRNSRARKIFVNDIGGIYRLDGGIIQVTFINKFEDPHLVPVEQGSLIWPEHHWHHYGEMLHWAHARGTFRGDIPQLRPH